MKKSEEEIEHSCEKIRRCVNLKKEMYTEIDELLSTANVTNRNAFIEKAIKFYIGYLKSTKSELYLLPVFNNVIHATIRNSEERLAAQVFKLAVEVAMQNRIIAYDKSLSEKALEKIREISVMEVEKN